MNDNRGGQRDAYSESLLPKSFGAAIWCVHVESIHNLHEHLHRERFGRLWSL